MTATDTPSKLLDATSSWLEWRGGTHIFPVTPGLAYREYVSELGVGPFGDGLLTPGETGVKRLFLPPNFDRGHRAELLVFGTGWITGPSCWVNDHELPLRTLSELGTGEDRYPSYGYSANRSYSLAEVPITVLRAGENHIRVNRCHAYFQVAVLRIFEAEGEWRDLRLDVFPQHDSYTLRLAGSSTADIAEASFFARHAGMDLDASGQDVTWQAVVNRDLDGPAGYKVQNHIGTTTEAPWQVRWQPEYVPSGPLQLRCRVRTLDGVILESPGGIVEREHHAPAPLIILRPDGFRPFAFHEVGANQDKRLKCELTLKRSATVQDLGDRTVRRAVLAVPLYGVVDIRLNQRHNLTAVAPIGDYAVRYLELVPDWLYSRINHLKLRASGHTGCFQSPGPFLHLFYS
jgi:hypothetical protein